MPIRPFLPQGVVFDLPAQNAMSEALDSAWRIIQNAGLSTGREALAAKIIARALKGERDPEALRDAALSELGVHR
ncbi:MAG: hypothetical protein GEU95_13755 [Rhizobiales bacterium]|nr:hypothetical protein [Hyphomicrobiales bacterium]